MASQQFGSGSTSSFGGLGRSQIGPNMVMGQQLQNFNSSVRQYSTPPNYHFGYRLPRVSTGPDGRHGSGARPNRVNSRDAERREDRSTSRRSTTVTRTMPTGPQEAEDWSEALDRSTNSI